jgi:hypothetical protein
VASNLSWVQSEFKRAIAKPTAHSIVVIEIPCSEELVKRTVTIAIVFALIAWSLAARAQRVSDSAVSQSTIGVENSAVVEAGRSGAEAPALKPGKHAAHAKKKKPSFMKRMRDSAKEKFRKLLGSSEQKFLGSPQRK